jgi:hypothetical protein
MWPPKRWEIESGHIRISSWVQGERSRRHMYLSLHYVSSTRIDPFFLCEFSKFRNDLDLWSWPLKGFIEINSALIVRLWILLSSWSTYCLHSVVLNAQNIKVACISAKIMYRSNNSIFDFCIPWLFSGADHLQHMYELKPVCTNKRDCE